MHLDALAGDHGPVAVLEIADRVGERAERDRVRPQIHFAVTMADGERRAVAGADHQIIVAGKDEAERERAAQTRQRQFHRFHGLVAAREQIVDEMQHNLGVGLGVELGALLFELFAQLAEIFDDAVVNDGELVGRVRMGVGLVRLAVRRPARVADADLAEERLFLQPLLEIFQFAFCTCLLYTSDAADDYSV